jgi:hypothetical protein
MMAIAGSLTRRSARSRVAGQATSSRALFVLALAALLVRMIVPGGWMPMPSAAGITIALCSGTGPAMVRIDLPAGNGPSHDHGAPQHLPCTFSPLAAQALPSGGNVLTAPPAYLPFFPAGAALIALVIAALRLLPPSRGPPHLEQMRPPRRANIPIKISQSPNLESKAAPPRTFRELSPIKGETA